MLEMRLNKREAREKFGQKFVEIMMGKRDRIVLNEKQVILAQKWKLLYEGHFRPFSYTYVYLVSDGGGASKVGFTNAPKDRLSSLQIGNAKDLTLDHAFTFRGGTGRNAEKACHRMLKANDAHIKGEWFKTSEVNRRVPEYIKANYAASILDLDAAWQGSEEIMPLARKALGGDEPAMNRIESDRANFLWLAGVLRSTSSVDT